MSKIYQEPLNSPYFTSIGWDVWMRCMDFMVSECGISAPLPNREATKSGFICACPLPFSPLGNTQTVSCQCLLMAPLTLLVATACPVGSCHVTEQSSPVNPLRTYVHNEVWEGPWAGISVPPPGLQVLARQETETCVSRSRSSWAHAWSCTCIGWGERSSGLFAACLLSPLPFH